MKKTFDSAKVVWGVVLLLGLAVGIMWLARPPLMAAGDSPVGYVDWEYVVETYAGPQIAAVMNERDRLQRLFDEESIGLSEEERLELFGQYEAQLKGFEEQYAIGELIGRIDDALAEAASQAGVSVVVDRGVILMGGVDLTSQVFDILGVAPNP